MSIFGRRQPQQRDRTPEERERARLERAARRAGVPPPEFDDEPPRSETDELFAAELPPTEAPDEPPIEPPVTAQAPAPRVEVSADDARRDDPFAGDHERAGGDDVAGDGDRDEDDLFDDDDDEDEFAEPQADPREWADAARAFAEDTRGEEDPFGDPPERERPESRESRFFSRPTSEDATGGEPTPAPMADQPSRGGAEPPPDSPTVEWDALADKPKDVREEPSAHAGVEQPTFADWDAIEDPEEPRVRRLEPAVTRAGAAQPAAETTRGSARFGDEEERPMPVRRVNRQRTLPPPPPAPGDPRPRRHRSRGGRIAGLVALVIIAGLAWLAYSLFQPFRGDGSGQVVVKVPTGATTGDIGDQLAKQGVVDSSFFFTLRARLDGANLKAGSYALRKDMSYSSALDALQGGPAAPKTIKVTIPEGRSRRETAPLVDQAGIDGDYLAASEQAKGFNPQKYGAPKGVTSLEGFLFPATYELKPGAQASKLVDEQLAAFKANIAKVDMRRAKKRNLTTYDVLIIASMIEREAMVAKERPIIAAVMYTRLREGMPLGIDATIRYATRNWTQPLRQSELSIDSPYNTRRRTGLPPGPIGSPGLSSIKAAANPANVDYVYYVVKPGRCGEHAFSSSDAQFQRDVDAYNKARAAAGGKSPTTC